MNTLFTNLQYADDTLIFGKCNVGQAYIIKCSLVCFVTWSGLKINFHKSSIINLSRRNLETMIIQRTMGMQGKIVPYFLGILITQGRSTKQNWSVLINKLERKLDGWKAKHLCP